MKRQLLGPTLFLFDCCVAFMLCLLEVGFKGLVAWRWSLGLLVVVMLLIHSFSPDTAQFSSIQHLMLLSHIFIKNANAAKSLPLHIISIVTQ
jgi:hypothetical protein